MFKKLICWWRGHDYLLTLNHELKRVEKTCSRCNKWYVFENPHFTYEDIKNKRKNLMKIKTIMNDWNEHIKNKNQNFKSLDEFIENSKKSIGQKVSMNFPSINHLLNEGENNEKL